MRLLSTLAVVALSPVGLANAGWLHLPSLDKRPIGMELAYGGTTLYASSNITDAAVLTCGDQAKAAKVLTGHGEAVLKFARQSLIQHLSFVADGLEGKAAVSISSDAKTWTSLADAFFTPKNRLVRLDVGRAQGRYLRLDFDLVKGGGIRAVQVIGSDSDANYAVTQNENLSGAPLNFAAGIGGGRLVYLSGNELGSGADALTTNSFKFPASSGTLHTAVYDLGQVRTLTEFGSLHSARPVSLAIYALPVLPERENWRGRASFDASVLESLEPIADAADEAGQGVMAVKLKGPVKARYIALRWNTQVEAGGFEVFGVSLTGSANVYFADDYLTATTRRDAEGRIVTTLRSSVLVESNGVADPEVARFGKTAFNKSADPMMDLAWIGGGSARAMSALSGVNGSGSQSRYQFGPKKEDPPLDPDPDADPTSIEIVWCPAASP
jgi:hypothetical protein